MSLKALLTRRPAPESSATDLRAALAEAATARDATLATVAALQAGRGAALLDGTAAEAEKHEASLRAARDEAERLAAIADALPERIATAEARELAAHLDKLSRDTEVDAREGAEVAADIVRLIAELGALIARHDTASERIRAANAELRVHGRPRVTLPLARVWPRSEVAALGPVMTWPGPRGACRDFAEWRAEADRAVRPV